MLLRYLVVIFLFVTTLPSLAVADNENMARELFAQYVALGNAFDPAVANLYSDSASIKQKREDNTEVIVSALRYKEILRVALANVKKQGRYNTYSGTSFATEGANVRIKTLRTSHVNGNVTSSEVSILVGSDSSANWRILEEISNNY
jgi:hypothetical protein